MPEIYRAFVFIMVMAIPTLLLARLATRSLVPPSEATLWRNCWLFTTCAVFLSGSFIVFVVLMIGLAIYVHKKTTAPIYLYIVLLVTAPVVGFTYGIPGVAQSVIELNPARLLVLIFLLPTALRIAHAPRPTSYRTVDTLVVAYMLLVAILSLRHGAPTYTLRIALVVVVDFGVPYFVFSRCITSMEDIRKALAAFVFCVLPFAAAGMFEILRGWRTYNAVMEGWGVYLVQAYLFRDGLLRAAVTAIEPIAFGYVCMVGLGLLLANKDAIRNKLFFWGTGAFITAGLMASLSRGPWLGTVFLFAVFAATTRRGVLNLAKLSTVVAILCVPLAFSPIGERIYRLLPFVGTVEKSNEEYRSKLIEVAVVIVGRNPLFGSHTYWEEPEMEQLIQGQGIVDIVNSYVAIALEYGLVGLGLFASIFVLIGYSLFRACFRTEGGEAVLLRAMTATLAAILLVIGTVSSVSIIPYVFWFVAGLSIAALRVLEGSVRQQLPKLTVLGYTR